MAGSKIVGQTRDAGFQVGARRTFPVATEQAWAVLTSAPGLQLWLGDISDWRLEESIAYQTQDGAGGEIRVVNPGSHLRLTWQPLQWERPSTIQVRLIPNQDKTTISFHQEHLAGPDERAQMKQHWQHVLDELPHLFTLTHNNP